jgi:hypothetical protein
MNRYVFSKCGRSVLNVALSVGVEDSIGLWIKSSRLSSLCRLLVTPWVRVGVTTIQLQRLT